MYCFWIAADGDEGLTQTIGVYKPRIFDATGEIGPIHICGYLTTFSFPNIDVSAAFSHVAPPSILTLLACSTAATLSARLPMFRGIAE
jgi:hypothetical protein